MRIAGLGVWSATSLFGEVTVGCAAGMVVCAQGALLPSSGVTVSYFKIVLSVWTGIFLYI